MKLVILLSFLTFGAISQARVKEYTIQHECGRGEVATVDTNMDAKGDGTFTVRATCSPAICFIPMPSQGIYTVRLIAKPTFSAPVLSAGTILSQIKASSQSEARAEAQKFVDQGYCSKLRFASFLDSL